MLLCCFTQKHDNGVQHENKHETFLLLILSGGGGGEVKLPASPGDCGTD